MTTEEKAALIMTDKSLIKEAMKEAIKEWLQDQFATFGKWTMVGLASMGMAAIAYMFMISQGWHK